MCRLEGTVSIDEMIIYKNPQENSLRVAIDLSPSTTIYNQLDFASMLEFRGADIQITKAYFEDGQLILEAEYFEDLTDKPVSLQIKDDYFFDPSIPHYPETIFSTSKATFNFSAPKSINYVEVNETES